MKRTRTSPGLLVSVRSADEAEFALAGGAEIIDVKEPDHGPLGRAADHTIEAVLEGVAGRRPVSAALGELLDNASASGTGKSVKGLAYVKWGLAGCGATSSGQHALPSWQSILARELSRPGNPQTVLVAYADWQCARAPAVSTVVAMACARPGSVLLVDTHCKDPGTLTKERRPTLLDWLTVAEILALCEECRAAGVQVALAGSLTLLEIKQLRLARPDWFAVRGAVCADHDRRGLVDAGKVRQLVNFLES